MSLAKTWGSLADERNQILWDEHGAEMKKVMLSVCEEAAKSGMYQVELTPSQCPYFSLLFDYRGEFFLMRLVSEVVSESLRFFFYDEPGEPRRCWVSWGRANVWKGRKFSINEQGHLSFAP